jgi:hypothetical protein
MKTLLFLPFAIAAFLLTGCKGHSTAVRDSDIATLKSQIATLQSNVADLKYTLDEHWKVISLGVDSSTATRKEMEAQRDFDKQVSASLDQLMTPKGMTPEEAFGPSPIPGVSLMLYNSIVKLAVMEFPNDFAGQQSVIRSQTQAWLKDHPAAP